MTDNEKQETVPENTGSGQEMPVGSPEPARHRGIYLLPNLFTTGALFSGFYAAGPPPLFMHPVRRFVWRASIPR